MGFFKRIRQQIQLMKQLRESIQDFAQQQEAALKLTPEGLLALSADEQYEAIRTRLWDKVEAFENVSAAMASLSPAQRTVYVTTYYEMEVNNGGLCQFFVNSSRDCAPYLSEALGTIGAQAHKAHFDSFIADNRIDVNKLSSFEIRRSRDFEKQASRYPFDAFDEGFYELPSIEKAAKAYTQAHIQELIEA